MSITTQLDPLRRDGESDEQVVARLVEFRRQRASDAYVDVFGLASLVRERLRPLLGNAEECECDQPSGEWWCDWCRGIHACARALLGRGPGEPSGLDEVPDDE